MAGQILDKETLVAMLPHLRAFARSLAQDRTLADDLVQETVLKAWENQHQYAPGTNLRAWLFRILRNQLVDHYRANNRYLADPDDRIVGGMSVPAQQHLRVMCDDVRKALDLLPPQHREALALISIAEVSYAEAAEICGCSIGTIKSRVSRARNKLRHLVEPDAPAEGLVVADERPEMRSVS